MRPTEKRIIAAHRRAARLYRALARLCVKRGDLSRASAYHAIADRHIVATWTERDGSGQVPGWCS